MAEFDTVCLYRKHVEMLSYKPLLALFLCKFRLYACDFLLFFVLYIKLDSQGIKIYESILGR